MIGAPAERYARVVDADDVAHDAERAPGIRQARALLDMQLEVRSEFLRFAPRERRITDFPERSKRVCDGNPVAVLPLGDARHEATERRRGPEEADAKASALLVRPRDDLDRPPQRRLEIHERLNRLDRAQHAERPVEPAALRNGVEMRAEQDRGGPPPRTPRVGAWPESFRRVPSGARPAG